MKCSDRFRNLMEFKEVDRMPIIEWAGWWDKTIERWHKEGLPEHIVDRYQICEHL